MTLLEQNNAKQSAIEDLKRYLLAEQNVNRKTRYYLKIPLDSSHNHNIDDITKLSQPPKDC